MFSTLFTNSYRVTSHSKSDIENPSHSLINMQQVFSTSEPVRTKAGVNGFIYGIHFSIHSTYPPVRSLEYKFLCCEVFFEVEKNGWHKELTFF
jgi:hypothetical protein